MISHSAEKTCTPLCSDVPYVGNKKAFLTTEDLIMPLSDDGKRVDMLYVTVGFV